MASQPLLVAGLDEQALLAPVAREIVQVAHQTVALEETMHAALERVPPERRGSARNLVHYVALRQHDLRELQVELESLGLSSLGRAEGWVQGSVLEVAIRTHEALALRGDDAASLEVERLRAQRASALTPTVAKHLLHQHTREMLGPRPADRHVYVMVTAPSADEADRAWMVALLKAGMNVLRVNCAHEGPLEWQRIIDALSAARSDTGIPCKVFMDLAGPKIRTGPIDGARRIATWKPVRDELGRVTTPARVLIHAASARPEDPSAVRLSLDDATLATLRPGDRLVFRDARRKKRSLVVGEVGPLLVVAHAKRRAYVLERARARVKRLGRSQGVAELVVEGAPEASIDVRIGDALLLSRRAKPGRPPKRAIDGRVLRPGLVTCTLPAALDHLEVGHRVLFDDGRIEAVVESLEKQDFVLRIRRTQKGTAKLRAEKGINLPDTTVSVPSLTDEDLVALAFVVQHADAVSLSFVRRPEDLRALHDALSSLGRPDLGVVLKIETRAGFENLPRLLLEGLRQPALAVMIARGDLAVEVGFERLAELQEEILWLCEASHVPVIWATQVLDTMARTGVPSRAEVTDAAASVAAECVMLNKGPYVDEAVRALCNILRRMEKHHYKKRSLFRRLCVSGFQGQGGLHAVGD
jgi:pyruvate kinase